MKMSRKIMLGILLGILLLALASCSRPETGTAQQSVAEAETGTMTVSTRPELDWRTDAWKFDTLSGTTHDLYITEYISDLSYTSDFGDISPVDFDCLQDQFYELDLCVQWVSAESQKSAYYLSCYDGGSGDIRHKELSLPDPQQFGGDRLSTFGMDVLGEEEYVLFSTVYAGEEREVVAYLATHMDKDGECQTVTDLYPAMRESGLEILPNYAYAGACTDRQGYYYLLPEYGLTGLEQGSILILSAEGKTLEIISPEEKDAVSAYAMKDPDGNALFEIYTSGGREICLTGYGSTGVKQYAQVQLDPGTPKAMSEDGYLYYGAKDGRLYRWDLYTGVREFCLDYQGMGLDGRFHMAVGSDGEPLLLDRNGSDVTIYRLGTDVSKAGASIRIVCLGEDYIQKFEYISRTAMEYSRNNPDAIIRMDRLSTEDFREWYEERDNYRTRALADLAAGKGADIYCVTAEDMEMLYEKGALMDLSEVLPREYTDTVFPGALGCGVIDGKQIGLTPEAYVSVVMVDNALWDKDRWTWDEAMAVKEATPGREHLLLKRWCNYIHTWGTEMLVLEKLYFPYLSKTPFVDLENGTCDFDSSRFVQLIEMVNHYESVDGVTPEFPQAVLEQRGVAFVEQVDNLPAFADMMWQHGDQYHLVGFPTDEGCGNYWNCEYYVVVNKDTKYWEQIQKYLITLFTRSNQEQADAPVRNDMIEEYIQDDPWGVGIKDPVYGSTLEWRTRDLAAKPDGSTWDQEYRELLETAEPHRESTAAIKKIILEELGSYYSGDKDAQSVAALIQNRVQLYLNEHQ